MRTNVRLTTNTEAITTETDQNILEEAQEPEEIEQNIPEEVLEQEETEQFEEDPFQFDEEPSKENCA